MRILAGIKKMLGIEKVIAEGGKLKLTAEQQDKLQEVFGDKLETVLAQGAAELEAETRLAQQQADAEARSEAEQQRIADLEAKLAEKTAAEHQTADELRRAQETIKAMVEEPEKKVQAQVISPQPGRVRDFAIAGHTQTHLFGVDHDLYDRSLIYNRIGQQRDFKRVLRGTDEEMASIKRAANEFGAMLGERYKELSFPNRLPALRKAYKEAKETGNWERFAAAGDIDITDITTQIPSGFLTRRMDVLLMYMEELLMVDDIFPVEFNILDGAIVGYNALSDSLTQSSQEDESVASGITEQTSQIARVKDVMLIYKHANMKQLERYYWADLWRADGSYPIKFTFIEWLTVQIMRKQMNEKNERVVTGVFVAPTPGSKQFFKYAADGVWTTHERLRGENRVYEVDTVNDYDSTTFIDAVESFVEQVFLLIGTGSLVGWTLHVNALHIPWYLAGYRNKYGVDQDFDGERLIIRNSGLNIPIQGVPNMGSNRYDMCITKAGNYRQLRNISGEEFNYRFRNPDLFSILQHSESKEGTAPMWQGRDYATQAALKQAVTRTRATNTKIFSSVPYTALAADATTADALANRYFQTIANTGPINFTTISNAIAGVLYRIETGSLTNATTVNKAGDFDQITASFVPVAVGDYLRVIYDPVAGKFLEYDRKVNGVIAANPGPLQAPAYVEQI